MTTVGRYTSISYVMYEKCTYVQYRPTVMMTAYDIVAGKMFSVDPHRNWLIRCQMLLHLNVTCEMATGE